MSNTVLVVITGQPLCPHRQINKRTPHTLLCLCTGSLRGNMSTFVSLSSGQRMPTIGLGTWKSAPGQVGVENIPTGDADEAQL